MDINSLKPDKNSKFTQGYFKPSNPSKYSGNYPIIYRSSWEHRLCCICDEDKNVISWVSEPNFAPFPVVYQKPILVAANQEFKIEYKEARYFPDYLIMKILPDGKKVGLIIEVKPLDQTMMPSKPKPNATMKQRKAYIQKMQIVLINLAKKQAAENLAKQFGLIYSFLSEDFFNKVLI